MKSQQSPYYAVIFTSLKSQYNEGYEEWGKRMFELVRQESGYLGHESYQNPDGTGVTISFWKDLQSIAHWKNNHEHQHAQELGRQKWYKHYRIRVCKVERDYVFPL